MNKTWKSSLLYQKRFLSHQTQLPVSDWQELMHKYWLAHWISLRNKSQLLTQLLSKRLILAQSKFCFHSLRIRALTFWRQVLKCKLIPLLVTLLMILALTFKWTSFASTLARTVTAKLIVSAHHATKVVTTKSSLTLPVLFSVRLAI